MNSEQVFISYIFGGYLLSHILKQPTFILLFSDIYGAVNHKYINYPGHVYKSFYNQSHIVVYQSITRTEIECGTQCAADPHCVGFQFDSPNMKCQYNSGCITLVNSTFQDKGRKCMQSHSGWIWH